MSTETIKRKIIPLAVILAIAGGIYYWIHGSSGDTQKQGAGTQVVTAKLTPQTLKQDIQAVGSIEASESAMIRTEVPGIIKTINFQEGQAVWTGDLLLQIDDDTYQTELSRSKAALDLAKLTFDRRKELRKSGAASAQTTDEAESALSQAQAAFDDAQTRLKRTKITAPFNGLVGLRTLSVGDYLNIGDPITRIVAVDPMKVQFSIPEKYFSNLKEGQTVQLTVDAWPGRTFEGKLFAIDPVIDPSTRNITAKALIPNPKAELRPGMFAYVKLQFGEKENAILIPEEALIPKGTEMNVMKVVDGKAKLIPVTIGMRTKGFAEITTGLTAGDEVITAGHQKVKDGAAVQPVPGIEVKKEDAPAAEEPKKEKP